MLRLHGVFLAILALTLLHNLLAGMRERGQDRRPWEQWLLWPLLLVLACVLLRDRWLPEQPSLLSQPWVAHLFPLAYLGALAQNTAALLSRGARLLDIPLLLFNVGVGTSVLLADLTLGGTPLGFSETTLLYEGSVLQAFLGTRLSHVWTLSWHLPFLLRRGPTRSLGSLLGDLLPAAVATLAVVMMVALHEPAADVVASFDLEPTLERLPGDLQLGVSLRPDREPPQPTAPGALLAWRLPADHPGTGLPPRPPSRALVLELAFPDGWYREPPDAATRDRVLLEGARRLAEALRPELLLPLPEPDGQGTLYFGPETTAVQWRDLMGRMRDALAEVSPDTRLGVRLAGTGPASAELLRALTEPPALVQVAGPRLAPGGHAPGSGSHADASLETWSQWLAVLEQPPELWILAVGCSPLAFGEGAQARFVEGCLARAAARPAVRAVLLDGWHDVGHTTGLLRGDDSPRRALRRLEQLLQEPRGEARR